MNTFSHLWQHLAEFCVEWEIYWIEVVEKINTHILYSGIFFGKSLRIWDNVAEYNGIKDATGDNMARARYMLDK